MGCFGFLKKPFDIDALLAIVHSHCMSNECREKEIDLLAMPLKKIGFNLATKGIDLGLTGAR